MALCNTYFYAVPGNQICGAEGIDYNPIPGHGGWGNNVNTDCFGHFTDMEPETLTGELREP